MAKRIVTLFVRDDSINMAVINGQRVDKWAAAPLEAGLVVAGVITDEAKVAAAIKDLLKQHGISAHKVIAALSGVNSLYRMITLPEMPDSLLTEAIRREAKRVLPVSLDEVYLASQTVPSVSRGERRLFLATYPKNATDAMVRTIRQAGLDPYLMDLAPLALSRVPDEPRCLIVTARVNTADVIIIEDRLPQLIRVLTLPSEATSITERLPAIAEELARTVVFYNSSHTEKPLNQEVPLFVTGELGDMPDIWPQLVGRLNFPVSLLPIPLEHADDFPAGDFMVNVGLALKEFAEREGENFSTINFNVLPQAYQPKRVSMKWVLVPAVSIVAAAVLIYLGLVLYQAKADVADLQKQLTASQPPIADQTQKIASLKTEIAQVTPQSAPIEAQTAQVTATAAAFSSRLSSLEGGRIKVDSDLKDRVVGLLPYNKEHLSLTSVNHNGSIIAITGAAADEDYIFQYARKLRESGGITTTVIQSIQAAGDSYTFSLLLK